MSFATKVGDLAQDRLGIGAEARAGPFARPKLARHGRPGKHTPRRVPPRNRARADAGCRPDRARPRARRPARRPAINSAAAVAPESGRAQRASAASISSCAPRARQSPGPASDANAGHDGAQRPPVRPRRSPRWRSIHPRRRSDRRHAAHARRERLPTGCGGVAELCGEQRLGHRPQHRFDHREVDRAPPPPVRAPLPQRSGGDEGEHQPAHRIEPREADARRDLGMAVEPGESGIALQQRAIGDRVRLRSGAPQTRGRDVDQIRD